MENKAIAEVVRVAATSCLCLTANASGGEGVRKSLSIHSVGTVEEFDFRSIGHLHLRGIEAPDLGTRHLKRTKADQFVIVTIGAPFFWLNQSARGNYMSLAFVGAHTQVRPYNRQGSRFGN